MYPFGVSHVRFFVAHRAQQIASYRYRRAPREAEWLSGRALAPRWSLEHAAQATRRVTLAVNIWQLRVRNEPIRAPTTVCHTASKHQRLSPLTHAYLLNSKNLFREFACMDGRISWKDLGMCQTPFCPCTSNVFDNAPRASAATHPRPRRGHAAATIHSRGPSAGPVRVVHQQLQHQRRAAREH